MFIWGLFKRDLKEITVVC